MSTRNNVIPLDPLTKLSLELILFRNVQNVEEIRQNVISGKWKCCVIKPSLIVDPLQVAVAANKAAVSFKLGSMVTRSLYTEILYNLSVSKNISQSLTKFGIEKDRDILVCFINEGDSHTYSEEITSQIKGVQCNISELKDLVNVKDVMNTYKLSEIENNNILDIVISKIAIKSFVSQ